MNGEMLEDVDSFKYLGSIIGENGGVVEDMIGRMNRAKVSGVMNRLLKVWSVGVNLKRMMNEITLTPSVLYGEYSWGLNDREKKSTRCDGN